MRLTFRRGRWLDADTGNPVAAPAAVTWDVGSMMHRNPDGTPNVAGPAGPAGAHAPAGGHGAAPHAAPAGPSRWDRLHTFLGTPRGRKTAEVLGIVALTILVLWFAGAFGSGATRQQFAGNPPADTSGLATKTELSTLERKVDAKADKAELADRPTKAEVANILNRDVIDKIMPRVVAVETDKVSKADFEAKLNERIEAYGTGLLEKLQKEPQPPADKAGVTPAPPPKPGKLKRLQEQAIAQSDPDDPDDQPSAGNGQMAVTSGYQAEPGAPRGTFRPRPVQPAVRQILDSCPGGSRVKIAPGPDGRMHRYERCSW